MLSYHDIRRPLEWSSVWEQCLVTSPPIQWWPHGLGVRRHESCFPTSICLGFTFASRKPLMHVFSCASCSSFEKGSLTATAWNGRQEKGQTQRKSRRCNNAACHELDVQCNKHSQSLGGQLYKKGHMNLLDLCIITLTSSLEICRPAPNYLYIIRAYNRQTKPMMLDLVS